MSGYRSEADPITSGIRRSTVHSYGTAPSALLSNAQASGSRDLPLASCIKHEIQPGETLQGIALRYGCTTQEIRRVNRLFSNDNIHLRSSLIIPVAAASNGENGSSSMTAAQSSDTAANEECPVENGNELDSEREAALSKNRLTKSQSEYANLSGSNNANLLAGQSTESAQGSDSQSSTEQKRNSTQFFEKYDQFLAGIKSSVTKMESETEAIAKLCTSGDSANTVDSPGSRLTYRTASDAERRAKANMAVMQRPLNGTQNGNTFMSRFFSSGAAQNSLNSNRTTNYTVTGYQTEMEHGTQTAFSNKMYSDDESDFYSI